MKNTLLLATLAFTSLAVGAQQGGTAATPMLWRDPVSIETRDLYWGNGTEARRPQPPFQFVEEKLTGTVAKVVVTDARGDTWDVKLAGEESHPEVAANRLLWALGYGAQEMYFVHQGRIEGATGLARARDFLKADGSFVAARFRRSDPAVAEAEGWAFAKNPFVGRHELSGLIILMALINNWDTEEAKNQETVTVKTRDGAIEQWFLTKDLGASFGRFVGPQGTPIKWHLPSYERDGLVAGVEGHTLVLNYQAYGTPPTRVPLEHARWFANLIGRLSDDQVRSAFRAAGATPEEVEGYTRKFMSKVAELTAAVQSSAF